MSDAKVGTLEKRSPLPAGQYWVDVFGLNIPKADTWFKAFSQLGVHVDATEHFEAPNVASVRNWYKFTYTPVGAVPVLWDTSLGFPTVADSSIHSSADTVSRPDFPKDAIDELADWVNATEQKLGGSIGSLASLLPFALLGLGAIAAYSLLGPTQLSSYRRTTARYYRSSKQRLRKAVNKIGS